MKRHILSLVFLAMMAVNPANAQVQLGVKGGMNSNKLSIDIESITTKSRLGWFIGPVLKIDLPLAIGADIAALFDQKKLEINGVTFTQKTIDIPINGRLNIKAGDAAGIYFAVGPQFSFNVGDSEFKWDERESYRNTFQLKKSLFSLNFSAGIMVVDRLELGAVYNVGLGKTGELKNLDENSKLKSKGWAVTATLYL